MFKKRKLISIMLIISMMLTIFPFAAFAEEGAVAGTEQSQQEPAQPAEVATQLPEADENGVITLTQDVELSATHEFSQDVTLNLNGHDITAKDTRALWVKAGTLTIEGSGTITSVKPEGGSLADSSSVIRVGDSADTAVTADAKLVLGEGVKVDAPATYGVTVFGKNKSLAADINGTIHSVVAPALSGNGGAGLAATTITLGSAANVTADNAIAIYHPQAGTMTINGATVQGTGGIEMKSGTLNVEKGSKITATAEKTTHQANGSGTSTDGYAIAVVDTNGGYPGKAQVNVTGGTVTGPVNKLVDKNPAADKKGSIAVSGGTFTQDVTEFLATDKGQNADGSIGDLGETNAVAKIGDTYYGSFSAAMTAAQEGAVIEVLKDVTVPSAQYVLNKNITLKSANKVKIDVTVATGETTIAFNVSENASMTLDGVVMTINGTANTEVDGGQYDGTAINLDNTKNQGATGANLTLKNGAVLNVDKLQRALIFSAPGQDGAPVLSYSSVTVNPGSAVNITNIDGNAANGGVWTVDKATVNVKDCGDHGLSVQSLTAKNDAAVSIDKVGLVGILAKDVTIEEGSDVTVSNSGAKMPKESSWAPNGKNYEHAIELKAGGKLTVSDSSIDLVGNKNAAGKNFDSIFANNASIAVDNSKVDGDIVYPTPAKGDYRVEYIVNGDVYYTVTKKAENGKVTYTAPQNPSRSGYTFKGWDYNGVDVTVATDNQASFKPSADKNVYQFVAKFSSNTPAVTEYSVIVKKTDNGSVSVSPKSAEAGDKVTITVNPDKGYVVDKVLVTDKDGDKITVTKKTATKYTFTMPKSKVDVKVTFVKEAAEEPEQPSEMPFVDVVKDAWYYPAVEYVYNNELMNGTNGGLTFEPNVNLNRAMMAAVLYNMEGGPACDKSGLFSDVADGRWYTDAINWAASNNIVSGMPDGTYAPNQALTREQMASILYRYAEYKGIKTDARADLGKFTDGNTTSAWATDVVQWAVAEKLINGVGTELQPKGTASRAQVATVLMNYCENVAK